MCAITKRVFQHTVKVWSVRVCIRYFGITQLKHANARTAEYSFLIQTHANVCSFAFRQQNDIAFADLNPRALMVVGREIVLFLTFRKFELPTQCFKSCRLKQLISRQRRSQDLASRKSTCTCKFVCNVRRFQDY